MMTQALVDPASLSLTEAVDALTTRRLGAEVLASAYLDRIERSESRVHAWAWFDRARLLAQARRVDVERDRGAPPGRLAGVPVGIKDIIATAGIPTRLGSPIFEDNVPSESAACVQRLEAADGIVQGKTVTTEFAYRKPGATTNPWNPLHSPGGSSSGSAAAVAAGFTAAAVGTQTIGSTIRPALYCGVVGFKPSFGLVSRHGVHPLSATLDHVGVLARTVEDAALLASCLVGFDPRDPGSLPDADHVDLVGDFAEPVRPPRIAAVRTSHWAQAELAQRDLFEADCAALLEAGASVDFVDLPPGFERAGDVGALIQSVEAARHFAELRVIRGDHLSREFRALCDRGSAVPTEAYEAALAARTSMCNAIERMLRSYDAIVTLGATGEAPRSLEATGAPIFCTAWSVCGLPAIALPTGLGRQGLPMGIQIVGAHLADAWLLRVARWCRRHLQAPAQVSP